MEVVVAFEGRGAGGDYEWGKERAGGVGGAVVSEAVARAEDLTEAVEKAELLNSLLSFQSRGSKDPLCAYMPGKRKGFEVDEGEDDGEKFPGGGQFCGEGLEEGASSLHDLCIKDFKRDVI